MESFTSRPELCGTWGAVASTHWIASAVGMRLLEAGGNAFDAAASAGFVLQIVEPHLNGPGGDVPIIVAPRGCSEPTIICGQGPSPAAASIERLRGLDLDLIPGTGLLACCVPGAFGAWLTMLRDYGTASLRDVLEPAVFYANSGHPILERAVETIESVRSLFMEEWKSSARTFLKNGQTPSAGSIFTNPTLGGLYERVLQHAESTGRSREGQIEAALAFWYEGPVAEAIDCFCRQSEVLDVSGRRHRGLLTGEDLCGWRPPLERPLQIDFRDFTVFKCGPWSQGPALLQALRILEDCDLEAHPPEAPEFVHLVTETIKLVMADRDSWYGDELDVPVSTLLSREYAAKRRKLIGARASLELRPGNIDGSRARLPPFKSAVKNDAVSSLAGGGEPTMTQYRSQQLQSGDTCHLDVADRWGNMVSATPSGGWLQSNPVIPALGFALGTRAQMFWLQPGLPSSLKPGKRPRTTLTPSMAFRHGGPYLAFGTPGGDQQEQWTLLLWLAHVIHRRPLQRAIETAAFHTDHLISSFWPRETALGTLTLESRFPPASVEDLRRRGHKVTIAGAWSEGRLSACSYERIQGGAMLRAGANPRGMQGYAVVR
jgi:gamma-glutamyltranspeptidase/glutathione hydrolase